MRLILASTSPARLALLRSAGIEPALVSPGVDEAAAVREAEAERGAPLAAAEMVQLLARAKAEAVLGARLDGRPLDGLVLGGDSAFELDGAIHGKPHLPAVARERWMRQRGRTGVLHSGHWLIRVRDGEVVGAAGRADAATVSFAEDLAEAEIEAYIATGEPLLVAGAFTIDSLGGPFISRIEGAPSTVVGLSLPLLRQLAGELGVAWPEFWSGR
ncbi:Maf family protein [Homoserinibacter sp. YIM 151385]|uniref:Maf family protein n=1 Tax=Homoserinibacter sp. YIM 151385 TaxID=2985506 RepID=UPI0022EFF340|nr:nucleoside triphosphate pyrophosphatase [Homoserinibacter sp. YIM 151385]WBU36805.1 Maf family protein [Homoserinibacter sp. YIM 151385]